jgi:hypothetical protein
MFRRLPRLLCKTSSSLAPRKTTTFLFSKARNGLLSTAQWCHPSPERASSTFPYRIKTRPLSDQDFYGVVAKYFETITSEIGRAQKGGSSITLEHRVRSVGRGNALIPYTLAVHWYQEANYLISFLEGSSNHHQYQRWRLHPGASVLDKANSVVFANLGVEKL